MNSYLAFLPIYSSLYPVTEMDPWCSANLLVDMSITLEYDNLPDLPNPPQIYVTPLIQPLTPELTQNLSLSDTLGLKYTVATFRKGVRAVQMVGRASMYSPCSLRTHTHKHTKHIICNVCLYIYLVKSYFL